MKELRIGPNEAGQRLDKFLLKYLDAAGKGFLYKMMRKKNITLNGKKCEGSEKLLADDIVALWLSDETIAGFRTAKPFGKSPDKKSAPSSQNTKPADSSFFRRAGLPDRIVYEDAHVLIYNKPSGMLSQKAQPSDVSANEYLLAWIGQSMSEEERSKGTFRPSVVNRLDRNTSGLLLAGKSLPGLQILSEALRERSAEKYYLAAVRGTISKAEEIRGYLRKEEASNTVRISPRPASAEDKEIRTAYTPLLTENGNTLLLVHLITGRTHQIRAHLSSIGHPILGDPKYGDRSINQKLFKDGIRSQLLHAYRFIFSEVPAPLSDLTGKRFEAAPPKEFHTVFPSIGKALKQ